MKNTKIIEKELGVVAVDAGMILISDPCYIDNEWEHLKEDENWSKEIFNPKHKNKFNYGGCCQATEEDGGQLNFKRGHTGAGVAVSSGFGDGCYPVFAKLKDYGEKGRSDWRVKEVVIKFIED